MARRPTQMIPSKRRVLDANILLRGVFGVRVRSLLEAYEDAVAFYTPDVCFEDARKYIPDLASRRNFDAADGLALLDQLSGIVEPLDRSLYEAYEELARPALRHAMSRTGRSWPPLCCSIARSGRKIRTFSEAVSPLGRPITSNSTCAIFNQPLTHAPSRSTQQKSHKTAFLCDDS